MSNFDTLSDLIHDGEAKLIFIDAVPRSVSTALGRALNEGSVSSVCVNEPFSRSRYDFEDAATRILGALDMAELHTAEPVTIVSKNMARNISQPILKEMVELASGIVFSVRDPRIQIGSLLTRIANNLLVSPGADDIKEEELSDEQIKIASNFLERGPRAVNFAKSNWSSIGEHFHTVRSSIPSVVVDGTALTAEPVQVLQGAAEILSLRYSERMIQGWHNPFINANSGYNPNLAHDEDAWTRDAVTSTGLHSSSTESIALERLPASLQRHLLEVAMPTYEHIMQAKQNQETLERA